MTTPTQNQNQKPQDQGQQNQARKDDMQNTGAQAKDKQSPPVDKSADKDVDQRPDAQKQDQKH
ncbi:MAG: hypothetical protein QM719_05700 [Thermomonas sp.]